MKTVISTWFECKVRTDKTMEDGSTKKVTETYVVDAISFTEAESRLTNELSGFSKDFSVIAEKIAPYREVLFSDNADNDKFYKVKVQIITLNEKTLKEQRASLYLLVQAGSVEGARKFIDEFYKDSMSDYVICSITDTPTIDVFEKL